MSRSGSKPASSIVFVITDLSVGGAQVMLLKLLERLDKRFSAHVISLSTPGELGPRMEATGATVESLGMTSGRMNAMALIRLIRSLKTRMPAIVHTWMYHADLLGGVAARVAGVPAVAWGIRNSDLDARLTKLTTRLTARACASLSGRVPDRILCCSEAARQVHEQLGYAREKFVVIPNGFDLGRFRPDAGSRDSLRHELELPPDAMLVGVIGRDDPQKNHASIFAAARALRQRLPQLRLILAGSGAERRNARLMAAVHAAGVSDIVCPLGLRHDMPRLMAALDVLVSCSSYGEAFPNVLGEAMACGVPCVATDVGDSGDIISDTGKCVPRNDNAALGAAIAELLLLPTAERAVLGQRARERIASRFEIGAIVRRHESLYQELTGAE